MQIFEGRLWMTDTRMTPHDEALISLLDSYASILADDIKVKTGNYPCDLSETEEACMNDDIEAMSNDDIIRFAQAQAQQDARNLASLREQEFAHKLLKISKSKALSRIKDKIQMEKKAKMRVVEHYLCDVCDKVIEKSEDGFVIHGNIYVADPSVRGGLIGNNFPEGDEKFRIEDITQTVMCRKCFCDTLEIHAYEPATKRDKTF